MIHKEYNPELAYNLAAKLGLLVAGSWILSFLIVVLNFPTMMSDLGYLIGIMSIWIVGKNLRGLGTFVMPLSWTQRLSIALLSFFGGALITTLAQYVYLAYFDQGHFMAAMLDNVTNPDFMKMMKETGNGEMLNTLTKSIRLMSEMTPREFTISLFSTNVTLVMFFSLIASLFKGKPNRNENN